MNIDRFFNWLITANVLLILFVLIGFVIDDLRVAINMTLIMIGFISCGCIIYETINIIKKIIKSKKK